MQCCVITTIWSICVATTISALKIGSFNTYQIFSNPDASALSSLQVPEILSSGVDVLCLQELFNPYTVQGYRQSLWLNYPYSFSALDIRSQADTLVPRTACSSDQIDAFVTDCPVCASFYPQQSFGPCIAKACPTVFEKIYLSECAWCFAFASTFTQSSDIEAAKQFCGNSTEYTLNQTDGTMIFSTLPIMNTWSLPIPSFLFIEKRVNIAQIGLCADHDPVAPCAESVIVACTHLNPTGYKDPVDTFVAANEEQRKKGLQSHVELNAYQIEYILDSIMDDTVSPWDSTDQGILGIIVAGDLNTGESTGAYPDNFDLFTQDYNDYGDGVCTYCVDAIESDFNVLALGEGNPYESVFDKTHSRDLDHVLIRADGLDNFEPVTTANFERIFMTKYDVKGDGNMIPLSDHYGVQLTLEVAHSERSPPPIVSTASCTALDIDYFLGHCSSLWEPLPKISTASFDDATSCPALAVDKFLSECSDKWRDATTIRNANADGMSKLSHFDSTPTSNEVTHEVKAASCEALEIDEFLKECSDIYTYIDARFAELSNPQDAQTLGVFNTFGVDDHTILMMSFVTNFILIFVACGVVNNVRKYQRYQPYHKPVIYAESGAEDS